MGETETKKSGLGKQWLFALPRLGSSLVLGVEGTALFTLYFSVFGLDPRLTSVALALGYLSIAGAQFGLGWVSDKTWIGKLGRRKPYLFIFGPLLGVSFIFLILPSMFIDVSNQGMLFSWLLVWEVMFRVCYAVTTPYQAWMAELFTIKQRPKVSQLQNVFNYIGNGIMAVLTLLVFTGSFDSLRANPSVIPPALLWSVVAFGVIAIVLFFIIGIFLPTEPRIEIKSNLKDSLVKTVKNTKFLFVVIMQGISGFGWSIISAVMLTYADVVLDLQMIEYIIVALCLLLGIFVFLNFWRKSIEKNGKKETLVYVFLVGVFFLPITLLGLFSTVIPPVLIGIIFILGIAAILGGWYLFPYILYADLAEDDEKATGELRAGIYAGFPNIILNIFQACGVVLLGWITSLPSIYVGGNAFSIGLIIWGPICSSILALSMFYTKRYVDLDFKWEKN